MLTPKGDVDPADADDPPEHPKVRRLRYLVTALTLASIVGVLAIAAAIVIRVVGFAGGANEPSITEGAADAIVLPEGERIVAIGEAAGRLTVVTRASDGVERIRRFDAVSGSEGAVTVIDRVPAE